MSDTRAAVVLLGPPASGKTSIARQLAASPGIDVLQTGYLLRREAARGSVLGEDVGRALKDGRMASTPTVTAILEEVVADADGRIVVFDGYPRLEEQLRPFSSLLKTARLDLKAVLILMLDGEEVRHRLVGRRVCANCGATYHLDYAPPRVVGRCDKCGTELVHRPDDQPEVVDHRLATYRELTVPAIAFFEQHHRKVTTRVAADGTPEQTLERVTTALHTAGALLRVP
jgi:adenylate kinase